MNEPQESDRLSIFLVEDNPGDVALFRQILRNCPGEYTLIIAGNGIEAIARLKNTSAGKPHIVFLDLNLPGKSGVEILTEMKADPLLSRMPVAVLTASEDIDDRRVCKALGVDAYFNKAEVLQDFFTLAANIQNLLSTVREAASSSAAVSAA